MPWYMTQYPPVPTMPNGPDLPIEYFGTYIYAHKLDAAKSFARMRNIGEIVLGVSGEKRRPEPTVTDLMRRRRMTPRQRLEVVHAATFLGYLAMQSLGTPAHEVIGDEGFIHEVIHALLNGRPKRATVLTTLAHFEQRVPGYLPR